MKTLKHFLLPFFAMIFFSGCLQVKTTVNLNNDGSGTIEEIVVMKSEVINMMKEFAMSFQNANKVILADIFAARDNDYEKTAMNAMKLYEETRNAGVDIQYIPQLCDIVNVLSSNVKPGDIVLTMGAGDVWNVAYDLVSRF